MFEELQCWRRFLRVPWTTRRSNQSILKKISPEYSLIGRTDAEAETPILWPPYTKSQLFGKDPDAGKDWRQEEKGTTEDEMAGWHHQHYGHEFEQALGVGDGQGGLTCCSPWRVRHDCTLRAVHEESDTTERLNWTELKIVSSSFYRFSILLSSHMAWGQIQRAHSTEIH